MLESNRDEWKVCLWWKMASGPCAYSIVWSRRSLSLAISSRTVNFHSTGSPRAIVKTRRQKKRTWWKNTESRRTTRRSTQVLAFISLWPSHFYCVGFVLKFDLIPRASLAPKALPRLSSSPNACLHPYGLSSDSYRYHYWFFIFIESLFYFIPIVRLSETRKISSRSCKMGG